MKRILLLLIGLIIIIVLYAGYRSLKPTVNDTSFNPRATNLQSPTPAPAPTKSPLPEKEEQLTPVAKTSTPESEKKLQVNYSWQPGKQYIQRIITVQDLETSVTGTRRPILQKSTFTLYQDVAISVLNARPDGGHELEFEYAWIKLQHETPQGVLHYDSRTGSVTEESSNPLTSILSNVAGSKFRVFLKATGEIESIEGIEEWRQKMKAEVATQLAEGLKAIFGEESIKLLIKKFTAQEMPTSPVKTGDRWESQLEIPIPNVGIVPMKVYHKFEGWEEHLGRECARIEYRGEITRGLEEIGLLTNAEILYEDGGVSGTIWFDPAICMIVESTIKIPITLKFHTQLPEQHPRSITMKIKQETTTKLVE